MLAYVTSGRDLLLGEQAETAAKALILADPRFSTDPSNTEFSPLPGTSKECAHLENLIGEEGLRVEVKLGEMATEGSLQQLNSPKVLHLATHGFFLDSRSMGASMNPMQGSGLALVGAGDALRAWREGAPKQAEDGILTAQEVGGLNLERTWLVTLSACETGLGESRAGEGVFGLRRGFSQAGARHLLMTLWPIADEETATFMADFYRHAFQGQPPVALAGVQREWLVRLREERGLATAVNLAGPFIMTFQGPFSKM